MIKFSGGTPPVSLLPIKRLQQSFAKVWNEVDPRTLYYGESEGHLPLRELIAGRMAKRGAPYPVDNVIVTNGSQQGLDLISKMLLNPGDTVIVEAPTYFGALQVFDVYEANYVSVALDDQGMIPEELERALQTAERPKMIYTIPTFQNPMGVTVPPERRRQITELARRYNVAIIEDDPYGEFWFGDHDPGPLAAIDSDVIYLGTFSKTIAPSLRMGWMALPDALVKAASDAKEGVDIQSDRLVQRAVVELASDGWLDRHIEEGRQLYRDRCATMMAALKSEMPESLHWIEPQGGFFVWCDLPSGLDSQQLIETVADFGVLYIPGGICYADGRASSSFRLGYTTLSDEQLSEGVQRLGKALHSCLATV